MGIDSTDTVDGKLHGALCISADAGFEKWYVR